MAGKELDGVGTGQFDEEFLDTPKQLEGKDGTEGKGKETETEKLGKEQRVEILKKFAKEAVKRYGYLIRSIVLFGSTARGEFKGESDIDIFIILDDTKNRISPGMREKIEWDLEDLAKSCSKQLSIQQPYLLTEFWGMVRMGHPIIFNFIREGVPVYDKDIFLPIKRLLQMGEIKPSKEAVEKFIERGPRRIKRVESAKVFMVVEDLYYAMLESAQAVLMFLGRDPPRPGESAREMRDYLVKHKLLEEGTVKDLEDIIQLRKDIEHKVKTDISGADLDIWIKKADTFVKKMEELLVKVEVLKRESIVEKSYGIMNEVVRTLIKSLNAEPAKGETLAAAFKRLVVDKGMMSPVYVDVFTKLEGLHQKAQQGKITNLPKEELLIQREYVRKFLREATRLIRVQTTPAETRGSA